QGSLEDVNATKDVVFEGLVGVVLGHRNVLEGCEVKDDLRARRLEHVLDLLAVGNVGEPGLHRKNVGHFALELGLQALEGGFVEIEKMEGSGIEVDDPADKLRAD